MKLSYLNTLIKSKTNVEDPEVYITGLGGFLEIEEVLTPNDYHDTVHPDKSFACLEAGEVAEEVMTNRGSLYINICNS